MVPSLIPIMPVGVDGMARWRGDDASGQFAATLREATADASTGSRAEPTNATKDQERCIWRSLGDALGMESRARIADSSSMEERANIRLQVFVPEGDRASKTIPVDLQDRWVVRLLRRCADLFEGATSYGRGVGVWKDKRGRFHWDRVTVIESWIAPDLSDLLKRMDGLEASVTVVQFLAGRGGPASRARTGIPVGK